LKDILEFPGTHSSCRDDDILYASTLLLEVYYQKYNIKPPEKKRKLIAETRENIERKITRESISDPNTSVFSSSEPLPPPVSSIPKKIQLAGKLTLQGGPSPIMNIGPKQTEPPVYINQSTIPLEQIEHSVAELSFHIGDISAKYTVQNDRKENRASLYSPGHSPPRQIETPSKEFSFEMLPHDMKIATPFPIQMKSDKPSARSTDPASKPK